MTTPGARIGPGTFVPVVGPSGAGKDTLIRLVADALSGDPRVRFPRRLVTRRADADIEDHDTIDEAGFEALVADGDAALHWRAHGLGYAIPRIADDWIAAGRVVVANISRRAVARAARRYRNVTVAHVTASPAVLRTRIAARGRERGAELEERLTQVPLTVPAGVAVVEIVNDGEPETAAALLQEVVASHAAQAAGDPVR